MTEEATTDGRKKKKQYKREWGFDRKSSRELPEFLNKLSAQGHSIFGVYESLSLGATYEILYYTDKVVEPLSPPESSIESSAEI